MLSKLKDKYWIKYWGNATRTDEEIDLHFISQRIRQNLPCPIVCNETSVAHNLCCCPTQEVENGIILKVFQVRKLFQIFPV